MSCLRWAAATVRRAPAVAGAVTRILGPLLLIVALLAAAAAPLVAAVAQGWVNLPPEVWVQIFLNLPQVPLPVFFSFLPFYFIV